MTITLAAHSPTAIAFGDSASVAVAGAISTLHVSRPAYSTSDGDKRQARQYNMKKLFGGLVFQY